MMIILKYSNTKILLVSLKLNPIFLFRTALLREIYY